MMSNAAKSIDILVISFLISPLRDYFDDKIIFRSVSCN